MAKEDLNYLLGKAIRASLEAGREIIKIYNSSDFSVEMKSDDSPLTLADIASHNCIAENLADTDVPMLSEEGAESHAFPERKGWTTCWIVDPLDGTKEFIKRNGEFTVNIAYVENGNPVFGVIYVPAKDILYYNIPGEGSYRVTDFSPAFAEGKVLTSIHEKLPVQQLPAVFSILGSRSHSSPETEQYVEEMRRMHGEVDFVGAGSSLKFCLLAEGKAHAYPRFAPTMEWDTAAGHAVLLAAGGKVVVWPDKSELRYNREQLLNPWFLASF